MSMLTAILNTAKEMDREANSVTVEDENEAWHDERGKEALRSFARHLRAIADAVGEKTEGVA